MGLPRRLIILGAAAAFLAIAAGRWRPALARGLRRLRTSSSPGIGCYDAAADLFLGGYYDDVAADCAAALEGTAAPLVLEVGPGPGHLAERLSQLVPGIRFTALDVDRDMLGATGRRLAATDAEAFERAVFVEGNAARMPFDDGAFDLVVSSLSAHHWSDAAAGFREILRVLRPGASALVFDLPGAWARVETGSRGIAAAAAVFAGVRDDRFRGVGPLTLVRRLELTAPADPAPPGRQ